MSNSQQVVLPRRSKQFWRDFVRVVRQARIYAKYRDSAHPSVCCIGADAVADELNELVSYYGLESAVALGVPESDTLGQTSSIPFEEKAVQG